MILGDDMPNHSYDIKNYESILKSEVIKLSILASVLLLLFVGIIVCSIVQIKKIEKINCPIFK